MQDTYIDEKNELKLKDHASRLVLTAAYKKGLQGDIEASENIYNNLVVNVSPEFLDNMIEEQTAAKKAAIEQIEKEEKARENKFKYCIKLVSA